MLGLCPLSHGTHIPSRTSVQNTTNKTHPPSGVEVLLVVFGKTTTVSQYFVCVSIDDTHRHVFRAAEYEHKWNQNPNANTRLLYSTSHEYPILLRHIYMSHSLKLNLGVIGKHFKFDETRLIGTNARRKEAQVCKIFFLIRQNSIRNLDLNRA